LSGLIEVKIEEIGIGTIKKKDKERGFHGQRSAHRRAD
jgi:hypothetical protein